MNYKLAMVGTSEDGDRIYCMLKCNKKTILRGLYDFNIHKFVILEFYQNKLPENLTPLEALKDFKLLLQIDYDWELNKTPMKIVELVKNKKLKRKKKK